MTNKWYCTCLKWNKVGKGTEIQRHKTLHPTTVNEEGICDHCGYYSVAVSDYEIYPRGYTIDGYRPVAGSIAEWSKKGLSATLKRLYFNPEMDMFIYPTCKDKIGKALDYVITNLPYHQRERRSKK